jgi:hypothetical protein
VSEAVVLAAYNETVYQIQKALKERGYDPGRLDGLWGEKTEEAVRKFQQEKGLFVSGKLDEKTQESLEIATHNGGEGKTKSLSQEGMTVEQLGKNIDQFVKQLEYVNTRISKLVDEQKDEANFIVNLGKEYGFFIPLITGILTICLLAYANRLTTYIRRHNLDSKQTDILAICNERYDKMWELLWQVSHGRHGTSVTRDAAFSIYRRYWGLQHDQYQYFKKGFVEESTFKYWLTSRNLDWHANPQITIGGITYQEGWNMVKKSNNLPDDDFLNIMTIAMENSFNDGPDKAIQYFHTTVK